ncbi:MAG: rod shape-determining protein RodA [Candidatus Wildermuthbacteria bacterium]|nr:rod shape-determining protein RodA [Candidatus Wildermuthbacteria bacterium]
MSSFFVRLKNFDWILAGSALLLTLFGLISVFSSSGGETGFGNFQKQAIFLVVGIILMLIFAFLDWRLLKNNPYLITALYVLGLLGLLGLFFFAPETRGTRGWYRFGGLSFDPIELMKLVLVILMAKYLSLRHIVLYNLREIALSGAYFGLPVALIFLQPNLGSALVLIALWMAVVLVSGIKLRHVMVIVTVMVLIFSLGWSVVLKDYQKARIMSFIEPELDPLGMGWSQLQSKIAIGNGGLFGQGFGKGTQTQYGFLSEPQTDFIFAAIGEEFGFLGVLGLFLLYFSLIFRVIRLAIHAESNFPRFFAVGFAALIVFQVFINVGMNLGLLPIIGLPLPLVSYGGSALIFSYIGLGILQSIKSH